ncbi:MAG: hypothetical protein LBU83_12560 [Bacteroidales bacterium]|nr:hypothetical protein [Bacteroidales bacterium]
MKNTGFSVTMMQMDKNITILQKHDYRNSGYVPETMEERISMVWPLTREAVSLGKKYDAEQRLQRHIINIVRK